MNTNLWLVVRVRHVAANKESNVVFSLGLKDVVCRCEEADCLDLEASFLFRLALCALHDVFFEL